MEVITQFNQLVYNTFAPINNVISDFNGVIMENITYGYKSCITILEDINLIEDKTEFYMAFVTTLMFSILSGYMFLTYYINKNINKNTNKNTNTTNNHSYTNINHNNGTSVGNNIGNGKPAVTVVRQPVFLKGLYLESIQELNEQGKRIIDSITEGKTYWALIRVQMRNYIDMAGTISDLHSNNVIGNSNKAFQTRDMYLIFRFKPLKNYNTDTFFGNVITRFMNYLNQLSDKKFHTSDFIVCAIGSSTTNDGVESLEFTNGLKHIRYEMENYLKIKTPFTVKATKLDTGSNDSAIGGSGSGIDNVQSIQYSLMLPIHNIYDLFMDVYNDYIFESKKYVIDDENYESWNGKSINEYSF